MRFSPGGALLDAPPLVLSTGPNLPWGTCARAATTGLGTFLLAWRDGTGALTQVKLPASGPAAAAQVLDVGRPVGRLEAVAAGDRFFLTAGWDGGAGGRAQFTGYEVGPVSSQFPVLAADTWLGLDVTPCSEGLCMLARRAAAVDLELSAVTMPLDGGPLIFGTPVTTRTNDWELASTAPGDALLMVNAASGQIRARVSDAVFGPVSGELQLSVQPAGHQVPIVGLHEGVALVLWVEPTSNSRVVKARRFDRTGTPIDDMPFTVSAASGWPELVEVLEDREGWVVVIHGAGQASIVTVSAAGVVGPERRLPFAEVYHLGLARAGDDLLLSMKSFRGTQWDPVLFTLRPDGGESTVECQTTAPKEHYTDVEVTGTGERLVVWQDVDTMGGADGVVAGVRFDAAGRKLDAVGFRISSVGTALEPTLASDGDAGFFVVWRDWTHLYARHLVGTTPGPVVPLTAGDGREVHHRVITTASGALVVYTNQRDGGLFSRELSLGPAGLTVGPAESITETGFNAWPAAATGEGAVWFAFSRAVTTTNTMQGFVRRFGREAGGAACTASWQCGSSRCDAGLCEEKLVVITPGDDGGVGADAGESGDAGTSQRPRAGVLTVGWACSTGPGLVPLVVAAFLLRRRRISKLSAAVTRLGSPPVR